MSQITETKIFNGKKYYLLTSPNGIEKDHAYAKSKDQREMGYNAGFVKDGDKYFVYSR